MLAVANLILHFTIANCDARVVLTSNYDSRVVIYDPKMFLRFATGLILYNFFLSSSCITYTFHISFCSLWKTIRFGLWRVLCEIVTAKECPISASKQPIFGFWGLNYHFRHSWGRGFKSGMEKYRNIMQIEWRIKVSHFASYVVCYSSASYVVRHM